MDSPLIIPGKTAQLAIGFGFADSALTRQYRSPSQQERLLQTYRLPSSASNVYAFTMAVLGLLKLVQSALALFNLGPLANDPKGLLIPDGLRK